MTDLNIPIIPSQSNQPIPSTADLEAQFSRDISQKFGSSQITLIEMQNQELVVESETNFRWLQLILFSVILAALFGFYVYQRTTISKNYASFIQFINELRHSGDYFGPGTGYDWAWYFKYPRLAFSMPNINLPAAVVFGWYNNEINTEMQKNPSCIQEMFLLAQNRPQATAAQILCTWYMISTQSTDAPKVCENLCPPIEPFLLADGMNTVLNTTLQLTAASAEVSGMNPLVVASTFVGSLSRRPLLFHTQDGLASDSARNLIEAPIFVNYALRIGKSKCKSTFHFRPKGAI